MGHRPIGVDVKKPAMVVPVQMGTSLCRSVLHENPATVACGGVGGAHRCRRFVPPNFPLFRYDTTLSDPLPRV